MLSGQGRLISFREGYPASGKIKTVQFVNSHESRHKNHILSALARGAP